MYLTMCSRGGSRVAIASHTSPHETCLLLSRHFEPCITVYYGTSSSSSMRPPIDSTAENLLHRSMPPCQLQPDSAQAAMEQQTAHVLTTCARVVLYAQCQPVPACCSIQRATHTKRRGGNRRTFNQVKLYFVHQSEGQVFTD